MIKKQKREVTLETLDKRVDSLEISMREVGVQMDRLEDKFDLCIEGFGGVNDKLITIEDRVGILEAKR